VDIDFFTQVMEALNMCSYPRSVGDPLQSLVYSSTQTYRWLQDNMKSPFHEKRPAFISHNSYPNSFKNKRTIETPHVQVEDIFFDLDYSLEAEQTLENVHEETKELGDRLQDEDLDHYFVFTTGKGFQIHIPLSPEVYDFEMIPRERGEVSSADRLKNVYLGIQSRLIKGLSCVDGQCTGDPKRICRVPYSFYASGAGFVNGRVCVPLSRRGLDKDLKEIIQLSENPVYEVPRKVRNPNLGFSDLADRLDAMSVIEELQGSYSDIGDVVVDTIAGELGAILELFKRHCPGLSQDLRSNNPHHKTRVAFVLFCKEILEEELTVERMNQFWEAMGDNMDYVDSWNYERRIMSIRSIVDNPRYLKCPSCSKIKSYIKGGKSLCIGDKCKRFWGSKK